MRSVPEVAFGTISSAPRDLETGVRLNSFRTDAQFVLQGLVRAARAGACGPLLYAFFAIALFFGPFGGAPARGETAITARAASFDSRRALTRVRDFLNENEVIRIRVEDGTGNGHQSTAATVAQRLRELGYRGLIQVIYDAEQAARLEFLFPPFLSARGPLQTHSESGIEFWESSYFESRSLPETDLGLIGATDRVLTRHQLNVRRLLVFQPLNWQCESAYIDDGSIVNASNGTACLPELQNLGFVFRVPTIDDSVRFIETDMAHLPRLAAKVPGLLAMAGPRRNHEIAAVYGHYISSGGQLLTYLGGLSWAMRAAPTEFPHGVVVPVFNAISHTKWARLRAAARVDPSLRDRVRFINVENVNLPRRIQSIRSDEILVVRVGPVAKTVFDYFMATSTVAPVVEGRNSANVMMLAGTPYLPSIRTELWHFVERLNRVTATLGDLGLQAVLSLTERRDLTPLDDDAQSAIGEFLLEARRPGSLISRRFETSRRSLDPVRDDKIVRGLLIALERRATSPQRRNVEIRRTVPARGNPIVCRTMFGH